MTQRRYRMLLRTETPVMAFDSAVYSPKPAATDLTTSVLIDAADDPCPIWTEQNPDRALTLLFVAPRDCVAVDVLVSL